MKKSTILLLPLLLLVGCKNNETSSELTEEEKFDKLITTLFDLEGSIVSENKVTLKTVSYLTSGNDYFDMVIKYDETLTKYKRESSYLLDEVGTESYLNDDETVSSSSPFHKQRYNDSKYQYEVIAYTNSSEFESYSKKYAYNEATLDDFYAVGFAQETKTNFELISSLKDKKDEFEYDITNLDCVTKDDKLTFSYEVRNYQIFERGQRSLAEQINYSYQLNINNNKCTSYSLLYEYKIYAADVAIQKMNVEITSQITTGNLQEYQGNPLVIE